MSLLSPSTGQPARFTTSYMVGQKYKRMKNRTLLPTLKNNAAAVYLSPVKIELLKGAGLLPNPRLQLCL